MPSPRKTMTFFARPAIAPFAAARAAPLRYHHCGVSPAGCSTTGTSTVQLVAAVARCGGAAQAASRVARTTETTGSRRGMAGPVGQEVEAVGSAPGPAPDDGAEAARTRKPAIMPRGQVRAMTTIIVGPTPRCPADVGVAFQPPRRARPAGRIRWRTRRQAPFAVRPDVPRPPLAQDSVLAA